MNDKVVLRLPTNLNAASAIEFIDNLYAQPDAEHYVFDFKELNWVEPFSLLYVSYHLAVYQQSKPDISFSMKNFNINHAHLYAAHMGFFKSFGHDFGKSPGEASGNSYYVPISIFNIPELESEAFDEGVEVGDVLERHSRKLACVLTREDDGPLVETLEYALREMFRNVVEHSGAKQIGFCAQYWPSKGRVELAILDNGIGIWNSLKNNPFLIIESDKDAINYSLLPGISGKAYKGAPKRRKGFWSNSGFGLYMTSQLCRNGGDFFMCSGTGGVYLKGWQKRNFRAKLKGTALRLALDTKNISSIKESLEEYKIKGQIMATRLHGAIIEPSSASIMLTKGLSDIKI